jgi:hypothetical protein
VHAGSCVRARQAHKHCATRASAAIWRYAGLRHALGVPRRENSCQR